MQVVGANTLVEFGRIHAGAAAALAAWRAIATLASWKSIVEVKRELPSADFVKPFTVFNIKGNTYRLITIIDYAAQIVSVEQCLTHGEYNKDKWKK